MAIEGGSVASQVGVWPFFPHPSPSWKVIAFCVPSLLASPGLPDGQPSYGQQPPSESGLLLCQLVGASQVVSTLQVWPGSALTVQVEAQ